MTDYPKVGVGVAVRIGSLWVLQRRSVAKHGALEWGFPGGGLEFNESVINCAVRETKEETGLDLLNPCLMPIITEDRFPEHNLHYITLYVWGHAIGIPRIMEPTKADASGLFPIDKFPSPLFAGIERIVSSGLLQRALTNRLHEHSPR